MNFLEAFQSLTKKQSLASANGISRELADRHSSRRAHPRDPRRRVARASRQSGLSAARRGAAREKGALEPRTARPHKFAAPAAASPCSALTNNNNNNNGRAQ